jgi:hypothetical protein
MVISSIVTLRDDGHVVDSMCGAHVDTSWSADRLDDPQTDWRGIGSCATLPRTECSRHRVATPFSPR